MEVAGQHMCRAAVSRCPSVRALARLWNIEGKNFIGREGNATDQCSHCIDNAHRIRARGRGKRQLAN